MKKEFPNDLRDVETETLEEDLQFPISIFDDPLEPEVQLEIKTELEDCCNDETMSQQNLPESPQLRITKVNNLFVNTFQLKYLQSLSDLYILEKYVSIVINTTTTSQLRST